MKKMFCLIPAFGLSLLCAAPVAAQTPPPADRNMHDGHMHDWKADHGKDAAEWHKRMCSDLYAGAVGRMAYLETKLSLTDSQRGAFDGWKQTILDNVKAHQDKCLAHTAGSDHRPTAVERETHELAHLQARMASLNAEMPALQALYQSLTPEQRAEFDRGQGMHEHGMHGHGMHGHMGGPERGMHEHDRGPGDAG